MKTASSLAWRSIDELPAELIEQLRTDATLEIRRDGVGRNDRRWQLLLAPGLAGLVAGVMAGLLIADGPLPSPLRLAALVVGAVSLAVWLAWFRGKSARPLAGQGVLLTPSTLVVVDHTSVAIVRAEHVDIEDGGLFVARELIHRADEILIDQLTRAQAADLDTRKADPWRPLASTGSGRAIPLPRTISLRRAALHGVGVGVALEALFALAIGWPAASARDDGWRATREIVSRQLDEIDRYQERAFTEQLAAARNTDDMTHLVTQALALGTDSERATRVLDRYRLRLADELAASEDPELIEARLAYADRLGLPFDMLAMIRARLIDRVHRAHAESVDAEALIEGLGRLTRSGADDAARAPLLARLAELTEATVAAATLDSAAQLYQAMLGAVPDDHPMSVAIVQRVRELTVRELLLTEDAGEIYRRFAHVRRLVPDPEVSAAIDARFEALVRARVSELHDTELLLSYYELRLNHEFNQFLTRRYEEVARAEIARARSASAIEHFEQEAEVLGLSDDFKATLAARLRALGQAPP